MGNYTGDEGIAQVVDPVAGLFKGSYVFVAANGDRLACTFGDVDNGAEGLATFEVSQPDEDGKVSITFVGEFNPVPAACTGRFSKVIDGSFELTAVTERIDLVISPPAQGAFTPPFDMIWAGEGFLEFRKGKR